MVGGLFKEGIYQATPDKKLSMKDLLDLTVRLGASDLHLSVDGPPRFRKGKDLVPYEFLKRERKENPLIPISLGTMQQLICSLFTGDEEKKRLEANKQLDISASTEKARFRINIGYEEKGLYATFRVIPFKIREVSELGFPEFPNINIWEKIIDEKQGLFLVTGITGSGKSTTLASLLQEIGRRKHAKIISVEDPIEYAFKDSASMFIQREVGRHTISFADAVKYSLRQDPDYLMVGETRDEDTAQQGIIASQTGHSVFTTVHTKDAVGSVERLVNLFPEGRHKEVRHSLSENLKCVISQELVPYDKEAEQRVLAMEIMVVTSPIKNLIREGKTEQLRTYIQGGSKYGMITMESHLGRLCSEGKISREMALYYARDREDMERILQSLS